MYGPLGLRMGTLGSDKSRVRPAYGWNRVSTDQR